MYEPYDLHKGILQTGRYQSERCWWTPRCCGCVHGRLQPAFFSSCNTAHDHSCDCDTQRRAIHFTCWLLDEHPRHHTPCLQLTGLPGLHPEPCRCLQIIISYPLYITAPKHQSPYPCPSRLHTPQPSCSAPHPPCRRPPGPPCPTRWR